MDEETFEFSESSTGKCDLDAMIEESNHDVIHDFVQEQRDEETNDSGGLQIQDHENVESSEQLINSIFETPNGTIYWIPNVDSQYKPEVGTIFSSFEMGKKFYEEYASKGGFDTRLSTTKKINGVMTHRYIVCNRHGKSKKKSLDSLEGTSTSVVKQKRTYKVTNCLAGVKLKAIPGTSAYRLYDFNEKHNHPLMEPENMDLTKARRRLQYSEQQYIHRMSQSNIGPSVAHKLMVLENGGYENLRGTVKDFNNFRWDVKLYIGERDAHMIVDKMINKKNHFPNYSFNYKVVENELIGMFWADEIAKLNYDCFGDVVAFDATYHTNMYDMIFIPFTGVDHHKKCVVFGAGLIGSEKIESYQWLLECFVEAHKKQPQLILTDQDPAMKEAVASMLTESRHRLCTWHITNKIPMKLKGDSEENETVRTAIHKIVWNVHLTVDEFENRWNQVVQEYSLSNHKWLTDMYNIREMWKPGFFKDIPMCCLMKTTSRAESTNAMFKTNSSEHNTLVQFMMCYETAMEAQRYNQRVNDCATKTSMPTFTTHLNIERHASKIYTHNMFTALQKEIWKGVWTCSQNSVNRIDGHEVCWVTDREKDRQRVWHFKVDINLQENTLECSCNNYGRIRYLCRHIFCVLKDRSIEEIPDEYIHKRWRKNALPDDIYKRQQLYGRMTDKGDILMREAVSLVETSVSRLRGDMERLERYVGILKEMKEDIFSEIPEEPDVNNKQVVIKSLLGVSPPKEVEFKAPDSINNKGSRTSKRIVGTVEKIKNKTQKMRRHCFYCGDYDFHDIRTCEIRKLDEAAAAATAKKAAAEAAKKAAAEMGKAAEAEAGKVAADAAYRAAGYSKTTEGRSGNQSENTIKKGGDISRGGAKKRGRKPKT